MDGLLAVACSIAVLVPALSACSSETADRPASSPAVPSPTVAASQRSVVAGMNDGIFPQCSDTVGLPAAIVVHGHNITTGASEVRCRTGAGDSDSTDVKLTHCDPDSAGSVTVYYWASADPTTVDQHVYAARADSSVRVVPGMAATALRDPARAITGIRQAAGC